MPTLISCCRICGNSDLRTVVDLGIQYLTGVFPRSNNQNSITKGPLELVKCFGGDAVCGLVQLRHSYPASEMYGDTYGYRSGLNGSMVKHLRSKVEKIERTVSLNSESVVIDIGSNDGTTLASYAPGPWLIGIDPAAKKYASFYPQHVEFIPEFFSAELINNHCRGKQASVITSFAMMYDLEDPIAFAKEVASILSPNGIWVFEQSYMPLMVERMAYDTICHEHIEYYGIRQIEWILKAANLRIIDIELNDVNGGSFSVTATQMQSNIPTKKERISELVDKEISLGYNGIEILHTFADRIIKSRDQLIGELHRIKDNGQSICGLGASTKGNVLLQYANLDTKVIDKIGEVNPDKWGCYTPGTWIPIVPEEEILQSDCDFLFVLPWHFKDFFMSSPSFSGKKLIFPLPVFDLQQR